MSSSYDFFSGLFGNTPEPENPYEEMRRREEEERRRREERLRLQGEPKNVENSQWSSEELGYLKKLRPDRVKEILIANAGDRMPGALQVETRGAFGSMVPSQYMSDDGSSDGLSESAEEALYGKDKSSYIGKLANRAGMAAIDFGLELSGGTAAIANDVAASAGRLVGADNFAKAREARAAELRENVDYGKSITAAQADKAHGGGLKEIAEADGFLGTAGAIGLNLADQAPNIVASLTGAKLVGNLNKVKTALKAAPQSTRALIAAMRKGGPAGQAASKALLQRGAIMSAAGSFGVLPETMDTYSDAKQAGVGTGQALVTLGAQTALMSAADAFGVDKMTAGMLSKALGRDIVEESLEAMVKKPAAKGVKGLLQRTGKEAGAVAGAAAAEGSTEWLQEGISIAAEMSMGIDTPGKLHRMFEAGAMGAITGGSFRGLRSTGEVSADATTKWLEKRIAKRAGVEPEAPNVGVIDDAAANVIDADSVTEDPASIAKAFNEEALVSVNFDGLDLMKGSEFVAGAKARYQQMRDQSDQVVQAKMATSVANVANAVSLDAADKVGANGSPDQFIEAKRDALASMFEFATDAELDAAAKDDQKIAALIFGESRRQQGALFYARLRQATEGRPGIPEEVLRVQEQMRAYLTRPVRKGEAIVTEEQKANDEAESEAASQESLTADALGLGPDTAERQLRPRAAQPANQEAEMMDALGLAATAEGSIVDGSPLAPPSLAPQVNEPIAQAAKKARKPRAKKPVDPNAPSKPARKRRRKTEEIEQQLELKIANGEIDPELLGQDPNDDIGIEFVDTDADGDQAMAHGDSATSPEAINRLRRVRWFDIHPGGNQVPVAQTVDAVDAKASPHNTRISVDLQGNVTVEQPARRQTAAQSRTIQDLVARKGAGQAIQKVVSKDVDDDRFGGDTGGYDLELDLNAEIPQDHVRGPLKGVPALTGGVRGQAVARARALGAAIRNKQFEGMQRRAENATNRNNLMADPTVGNLTKVLESVPDEAVPEVHANIVEQLQKKQAEREATLGRTATPNIRGTERQVLVEDGNLETIQSATKDDPKRRGWKGGGERVDVTDRSERNLGPSGDDGTSSGAIRASDSITNMRVDGVVYEVRMSDVKAAQRSAVYNGKYSPELFKHIITQIGKPTVEPAEMIRRALRRGQIPGKDAYNAARFKNDLVELFELGEDESQQVMNVVEARAQSLGISTDQYVAARISHLRKGTDKDQGYAQGWRGSVRFLGDQRAVISAMQKPDVTTVLHELGHIWRREISALDPKAAEVIAEAAGVPRVKVESPSGNKHTSVSLEEFEATRPVKKNFDRTLAKGEKYDGKVEFEYANEKHDQDIKKGHVARTGRWLKEEIAAEEAAQGAVQPKSEGSKFVRAPWNRDAEERFAQMVETYFKTGVAPTKNLEPTFFKLKTWFANIYSAMIRNDKRFPNLSPEVRTVMDNLLTERASIQAKKAGVKPIPNPMDPTEELGQPQVARPSDPWMVGYNNAPTPERFLERAAKTWHNFVRELVNKQDYLERSAKKMNASGKFSKDFASGMLHAAARMRTASMGAMYVLHRGTRRFTSDGYERTGDGLAQILHGLDRGQFEDISRLMNAERHMEIFARKHKAEVKFRADHAAWALAQNQGHTSKPEPKRKDYGPDIDFDIVEDKYKALLETRAQIIADYGTGIGVLRSKIDEIRKWSVRAIVDPMVEVGRLSPKQRQAILDKNQKYVTFDYLDDVGFSPDEAMQSGFGDTLPKMITGMSAAMQVDPIVAMTQKAMAVQYVVERQRVINSLTAAARKDPTLFPELVPNRQSSGKAPTRPVLNSVEITEWVNGQETKWSANNEIAHAIDMLEPPMANIFLKAMRGATLFKRKMTTSTPIFALRNMSRDQWSAGSNSKYGYIPYKDFYTGVFRAIAGGDLDAEMDPAKREFLDEFFRNNAGLTDIVSVDLENQLSTVDSLINGVSPYSYSGHQMTASTYPPGVQRIFAKTMGPLEHFSQQLEMGTRIGAFMNARKKGANMNDAAEEAREITLDFSRKGSLGGKWNRYEAFINAAIQDANKLYRNLSESPGSFLLRSFVNFTVPSLINVWMHADDDDYEQLPEWRKALFYNIKLPGGDYLPIPRPIGILPTVMGYGVEKMLKYMNGDPNAPGHIFNALRNAIPAGSSIPVIYRGERYEPNFGASVDLVPDFAQPVVDVMANMDSFRDGRQITPFYEQDIDPTQMGAMGTTGPISEGIAKATGGLINPYQAEYMAGSYGGTMGRQLYQAADSMAEAAMGREVGAMEPRPLLQRLGITVAKPVGFSTRSVTDLAAVHRRMQTVKETLEKHLTNRNLSAYTAYVSTPEAKRTAQHWILVDQTMKDIREQRKVYAELKNSKLPETQKNQIKVAIEQRVAQEAAAMMLLLDKTAYDKPGNQPSGPKKAGVGE